MGILKDFTSRVKYTAVRVPRKVKLKMRKVERERLKFGVVNDFIAFMQYDAVRVPRKIKLKLKKENRELTRLNIGDEHFGYDSRIEDLTGVQGGVGKKLDVQKMYKDEGDSEDLDYKPEVKAHEVVGYVVLDGKKRVVYRDYY